MSLWNCPQHGPYGSVEFCPKCGDTIKPAQMTASSDLVARARATKPMRPMRRAFNGMVAIDFDAEVEEVLINPDGPALADRILALEADNAALVEALTAANEHIRMMQDDVCAYLPPDSGLSEHDLANTLIERLDGPDQRRVQSMIDAALAKHGGS